MATQTAHRGVAAPVAASDPVSNWILIQRLLKLAWGYRWACIKVLLLQVVLLSLSIAGLGMFGLGVDAIRAHIDPTVKSPAYPFGLHPSATTPIGTTIGVIAAGMMALAVARSILTYIYTIAVNQFVITELVVDLRAALYAKVQRLGFRFFDSNETGSIINRVTDDVQRVRLFVDGVILQTIVLLLSMAVYLCYMMHIHVLLTCACLATTPLLYLATMLYLREVKPISLKTRELFDTLILTLSETVQGMQVVKGLAIEQEKIAEFAAANRNVLEQQYRTFWLTSIFTPVVSFIPQINMAVLLIYGGYLLVHDPSFTLGQGIIVFAGLLRQVEVQIASIANISSNAQLSLTGAQRVFEVLDADVEIRSKPNAVRLSRPRGEVRFENVTFGYNPLEPVLREISFTVPPGSCIAIAGATGAGKSTLLSLIPRFYDPDRGRVTLDGVDLRDLDVNDLRRGIGFVFQESFLFSHTVAANIAFGHPRATMELIETAARIAAAHDFIMALPQGYDTILGERAGDLSGGQRQRLAIARAILLDPPILMLDDPTAAIDPQTEQEILEAMDAAMRNRTSFLVAHRLSSLRRADTVLVLEGGRIVQTGTPDELSATSGLFLRAAKLQGADEESLKLLGLSPQAKSPPAQSPAEKSTAENPAPEQKP